MAFLTVEISDQLLIVLKNSASTQTAKIRETEPKSKAVSVKKLVNNILESNFEKELKALQK